MRIAVLADIHGNFAALEAVLADLEGTAPDLVLNLGDCLSGPLDAAATADRLMDLGWPTVRGNHDRELTETAIDAMSQSDRAAAEQISDRHRAWLSALPATLAIEPGLFLCHGTPASDLTYLTECVTPDGLVRPAHLADLTAAVEGTSGDVILCGHTHVPRLFRLEDGRLIVNPGSVGVPGYRADEPYPHIVETGSPHARYLIMDHTRNGWCFAFRALAYDWDRASALARSRGREDWARVLATGFLT
jgi:predicted phosphodiesterase